MKSNFKEEIRAETSFMESAKIQKKKAKSKLAKHKQGKYIWRADNNTIFSFTTKKKMEEFKKNYGI